MPPDPEPPLVVVSAAVIERNDAFLLTRRPAGTHLAGYWEFPGGKRHRGESPEECLRREMREELAVEVEVGRPLVTSRHAYPDRTVELRFFRCTLVGEPVPQLGQEMRWVARGDLATMHLPPADEALVTILTRDPGDASRAEREP